MPHSTQKFIPTLILSLFLLSATVIPNAYAIDVPEDAIQDSMKVATIAKMYAQDIYNEGMSEPILAQYGDAQLQAALKLEQAYFDKEQMICGTGHDILWDSQDPDYAQNKNIFMTKNGLVTVSLAQGGDIQYQLTCNSSDCQISDVMTTDNKSLKDFLNKSCR